MTDAAVRAALLLAYGGPASLEDVEPYLKDVRGGRPTPPAVVEEIRARYAAIGGGSPLLERTREQAATLGRRLGPGWRVEVGMRHWRPFIKDSLETLAAQGVRQVVALPMAPHYSDMSVGAYRRACESAPAVSRGVLRFAFVPGFSEHPRFLDAVAERAGAALERLGQPLERVLVLFTAHSLPERILAQGDPYADRLAASARTLAARLGLSSWRVAYQSAGRTSEKWLGPDISEVLAGIGTNGTRHVLVVPVGFVCDHVEVLYDVDIECRAQAAKLGLTLARSESLNASPALIDAMEDLVLRAAEQEGWA